MHNAHRQQNAQACANGKTQQRRKGLRETVVTSTEEILLVLDQGNKVRFFFFFGACVGFCLCVCVGFVGFVGFCGFMSFCAACVF